MALADRLVQQVPTGVAVMAAGAREIQLAAWLMVEGAAALEGGRGGPVDRHLDRPPAGLHRHERGQRQQVVAAARERRRALARDAARIDAIVEIHHPPGGGVPRRQVRRDAAQVVRMASGAGAGRSAGRSGPRAAHPARPRACLDWRRRPPAAPRYRVRRTRRRNAAPRDDRAMARRPRSLRSTPREAPPPTPFSPDDLHLGRRAAGFTRVVDPVEHQRSARLGSQEEPQVSVGGDARA